MRVLTCTLSISAEVIDVKPPASALVDRRDYAHAHKPDLGGRGIKRCAARRRVGRCDRIRIFCGQVTE
jgi:hypothetical protein